MKKIFAYATTTLLILLFTVHVFAQQDEGDQGKGNTDPQKMAKRQTELMEETLGLTAEQMPQVLSLNLEYATELKTLREAVNEDRNNGRGALTSMMNKKDVDLKKILTSEQWEALKAWRKAVKENGRSRKEI